MLKYNIIVVTEIMHFQFLKKKGQKVILENGTPTTIFKGNKR